MGTYGTFTGVVRWYDADTQTGYILSLRDGEVQASMVGDGITAANDNIVLDENGIIVHDFTGASIITPMFGVGVTQDVLRMSEDFSAWTRVGTATVTADTHIAPDGIEVSADTISLPAVDDYIFRTSIASPTMTAGQSGVFSVWLKAASAGTIQLRASIPPTGTTIATTDVAVTTQWHRYNLVFTNTTGIDTKVNVSIKRAASDQLSQVYAWGAQVSFGVDRAVPYWPYQNQGNGLENGMFVTGILGVSGKQNQIVIGSAWSVIPTGARTVAIGSNTGASATSDDLIGIGGGAGTSATGVYPICIGRQASAGAYDNILALGPYAAATAHNQIVLGSSNVEYTDLYGGGGVSQSTPPTAFSLHGTGGSGTNIAGTALKLAGGQGTGTGAGGAVVLQYAPAGGSGSSANALVDCLTINASGVAVKPGANSTTAIQMQNAAGTAVLTIDTTNARVNASTRYDIAGTQMLYKVGTHNYMVGPSGNATMSGDSNMMMGGGAGVSLTTGTGNVILGVNAMYYATGATSCLALGSNALQGVLSQTGVVGIGNGAGFTGPGNHGMLIGSGAGYYVTGARVIAIGGNAVRGAAGSTTADDVIGIGYESFTGVTTGGENVGVGSWTGVTTNPAYKTTTGLQNTYVGTYAGQASATQRNRAIALGYRAFVDADNTCVIGGTGFFRVKTVIGATTAAAVLDVVGGADELQIRVKGYSTQTANLQEWHNSSATVLASVGPLGQLIVNESGADADSRIEGDTDAYLTFWDASTDRVGVGTNAPGYKLDVAGGVNVSSGNVYRVNGTQVVTAQQAAIADTTNTADVGVQLNKVIAMLRVHGLIAT